MPPFTATSPVDAAVPDSTVFPASFAQQRMWFLEQLHPGRPLYNIPVAVRLQGALDPAALEAAVNDLVRRHEILRTSFTLEHHQPVQVVAPVLAVPLTRTSLRDLPPEVREARACALACEDARRTFDLRRLPLLHVHLIDLADDEHILVLTMHHIIFDGWSLTVFFEELAACYLARRAGRAPDLSEPSVQYGDYAVWQRERFRAQPAVLARWQERLAGHSFSLELPADRPRPAVQGCRGHVETLDLPAGLHRSLEALARHERATLAMTLLAGFAVLLHRHTGQTDLLVGTPVAGRTTPETERLLGLFINTLVVRLDVAGDPTFRTLLGRVRAAVLDALAHDEVPFERLVEKLRPERNLGRAPLFQVMFAHERAPLESVVWPGLTLTQLELDSGTAKYDLTLYLVEGMHGLRVRAEYDADLFEHATVTRLLGHFAALLESAVAKPDQPVGTLSLLTDAERWQLLVEWNQSRADYPRDRTVPDLVSEQARRTPDAVAIEAGNRRVTYRQLEEESDRFARRLRAAGVRPGVRVGLCVDRTPAMLVSLLAIMKAGGAYVPLDPAYPRERLAHMLEDSRAPLIVTEGRWLDLETLPPGPAVVLRVDEDYPEPAPGSAAASPVTSKPDDPAYVIYTSGSTGRPKGVVIPQRALVNFLCSMRSAPGLAAGDVMLAVTTLSFDIAALELYLPLTVGARVVLASRADASDPARLAALLASSGATVMQATPATWRMLLAAGWEGSKTLRIFCGGEALPRDLADRLLKRCAELWNLYGPTETTVWSSLARVEPAPHPVVVGHPVANTQLHVLDARRQLVPVGVPGELFIGGDGLALGYLNQPGLTEEKFVPHPFAPGERLYRTGDLARRRPNGDIELLGRLDHQVKIRGHRIELGEIETALRRLPAVREVVVVAREDTPGDIRLAAYFTGDPAGTADEFRRHLREILPDYMVPSAFVALDRLPLTPNGKVDRRALPPPAAERVVPAPSGALRDGLEQSIAAIWSEVLGVKDPGADDNFFDLGGHSLRLAEVQARLRSRLGHELPMLTLFQHPTIRALTRALDEESPADSVRESARRRGRRQRAAAPALRHAPAATPLSA